jgi:pyruvyltransferase
MIVPAFWYLSNNFGDALTPYLIRKLSNKIPVWIEPMSDIEKVLITGSILNIDAKNSIIWGCGLAESFADTPLRDVRCIRGNLSLKKYIADRLKYGQKLPEDVAVGDPCLIMPTLFSPVVEKKYKIGIVPHYIEAYYFFSKITNILDYKDILVLDVNKSIEEFIIDLLSCETILSSSLHGIICADAYNIPSSYVKFTDKIGGDGFKYEDWYSNFDGRNYVVHDMRGNISIEDIYSVENKTAWLPYLNVSITKIIETCPFI